MKTLTKINCLNCKHSTIYAADPGYSELTPGCPGSWRCVKNHWDEEDYTYLDKNGIVERLMTATNCKDFETMKE